MDYSALTQAELDAEAFRLATEFAAISDQRYAVLAEQEKRATAARAKARYSVMSEQDKEALRKELG
jgi:hypothetical protein